MKKVILFSSLVLFLSLNGASLFAQVGEGTVSESHSRYCASIEKVCLQRYDTIVAQLRQRYDKQLISRQELSSYVEKVATSLNQAFQNIDNYANQLEQLCQENTNVDYNTLVKNYVDLNVMPQIDMGMPTATSEADDYDFLFKGLNFADACSYFGGYYKDSGMKEMAVYYYSMALDMYETLNGFEGSDFADQIKQIQSALKKLQK